MGTSQSRLSASDNAQKNNEVDVPLQDIRRVVLGLLADCEVPYVVRPYDQILHDHCLAVCEERGYPIGSHSDRDSDSKLGIDNKFSLLPFLPTGVSMSSITYGHLNLGLPRLTYIALFTTFLTYMDDLFKRDIESVALFAKRLVRGESQGHPVLDGLVEVLNDAETHFGRTVANIVVHDVLAFFNSLLLNYETQGLNWSRDAAGFPNFIRLMSGVSTAYSMFTFPADMALTRYIQAIPEIGDYNCYLNDVLSFYKEEIRGEEDNYISQVAKAQGLTKNEVLKKLANDVANTTNRLNKILEGDPDAYHAWSGFKSGYIHYHISNPRYKLDDLHLG
ncbi:hypothetical protein D9619_009251 [Psilocybe cf. subviscida]|uniref:Terpene synthase n=1 Tax=Psilocybe cf. subviscida TaxID=2480587 RepID=A0A8H5BUR5_9AGAR|nr:hypothetical protein D9619_009251 [Psilocybe cf. subviscida]